MELNVMYTINNKYIDIMLVSLTSLVVNNKSYDKIKFFIVCDDFEIDDYRKIENYVSIFGNVDVFFYSLNDFNIEKFNIPDWRGSQIANARLFHQSIVSDSNIKQLLYLDSDTIVVGDLGELYNCSNKVMGVKDANLKSYMYSLGFDKYYNSGVLLFDREKWANDLCEERIVQFLRNNAGLKLTYPDQDLLNFVLGNEISDLDFKYNIGPWFMCQYDVLKKMYFNKMVRQIEYSDVQEAILDAKIWHNYGNASMKPWVNNKLNAFSDEFMRYMSSINPDFVREELTGVRKILCNYDKVFYTLLVVKSYLSVGKVWKAKRLVYTRK